MHALPAYRTQRVPSTRPSLLIAALGLAFAPLPLAAQAQSYTPLGDLAGGSFSSRARAVSGDGTVVVGQSDSTNGRQAFRWTPGDGMVGLGFLPGGMSSNSNDTSSNGNVIVGSSAGQAFRWTKASGMVGLGLLPGARDSDAAATSSDGGVVVGYSGGQAFRWTEAEGMVSLRVTPQSPHPSYSDFATGVSADGSVVVGNTVARYGWGSIWRWTAESGMVGLDLLGFEPFGRVSAVSADGNTVVGWSVNMKGAGEAFRWTEAGGTVGLGFLPGGADWSGASAVSADGSVIVGNSEYNQMGSYEAFRWTEAGGMQRVVDWLAEAGVTVAADYHLYVAADVSADGTVVVGTSEGPSGIEAYIARVSSAGNGAITLSNVQASLAGTAEGIGVVLSSSGMVLNGAHSRPLSARVGQGQKAFWASGDWGTDDHGSRDGDIGLAEMGLGHNLGTVQLNGALGHTWASQDLTQQGDLDADGTYLMAEALIPINGNLWGVVSGYYHWGDADIQRGYLNAGLPDVSIGNSNSRSWAVRARLEWDAIYAVAGASLSPYGELSYAYARMDAYTETGGGFPASFDERKDHATELRIGMHGAKPLSGATKLLGMVEGVHRFEDEGGRVSGEVIGLFPFDLSGQEYNQNWLRAGVGLESKLGGGVASLMLNVTTEGEAPNTWLAARYQLAF